MARLGMTGKVRIGLVRHGTAGKPGRAGEEWYGKAGEAMSGLLGSGEVRQARRGQVRWDQADQGKAGEVGQVRRGLLWCRMVRQVMAGEV